MDLTNSTLPELEKLLSDLRVRYNSGDRTVETRLRAVAARVEQLRASNPETRPIANKLEHIARILSPVLQRTRCCGR